MGVDTSPAGELHRAERLLGADWVTEVNGLPFFLPTCLIFS